MAEVRERGREGYRILLRVRVLVFSVLGLKRSREVKLAQRYCFHVCNVVFPLEGIKTTQF